MCWAVEETSADDKRLIMFADNDGGENIIPVRYSNYLYQDVVDVEAFKEALESLGRYVVAVHPNRVILRTRSTMRVFPIVREEED
jgi:hypothetical protein